MHADPCLHALFGLACGIDRCLVLLNCSGAAHGVDHAVELTEDRVTGGIDDAPLVLLDEAPDPPMKILDERDRPLFVTLHHAAEAAHVRHEDGGELPALTAGLLAHGTPTRRAWFEVGLGVPAAGDYTDRVGSG